MTPAHEPATPDDLFSKFLSSVASTPATPPASTRSIRSQAFTFEGAGTSAGAAALLSATVETAKSVTSRLDTHSLENAQHALSFRGAHNAASLRDLKGAAALSNPVRLYVCVYVCVYWLGSLSRWLVCVCV